MLTSQSKGISVIVCCHNSSERLENTLQYLSLQKLEDIAAELIIVDNNSDDQTAVKARQFWEGFGKPFPMKLVEEPQPGLTYARMSGVKSSSYGFCVFCDDDNWLSDRYVQKVFSYFENDEELAVIGGNGEAVFESAKPVWFDHFYHAYAVNGQSGPGASVNTVYGAGMAIRKAVIEHPLFNSIPLFLSDRKGGSLSSGGDAEICWRIRLMGFTARYAEDLTFKHFIPARRATWKHLLKLHTGFSRAVVPLEAYELVFNKKEINSLYWLRRALLFYGRVLKYAPGSIPGLLGSAEGNGRQIQLRDWLTCANEYIRYNFGLKRICSQLMNLKSSA